MTTHTLSYIIFWQQYQATAYFQRNIYSASQREMKKTMYERARFS